jgi:AAA15 family ATPase/GTPase
VLREIVDIIRELDVDILAININEYEVNQDDPEIKRAREAGAVIANKIVTINSTHQNLDGKNEVFDFMNQESDGTIRLATMIGRCLLALKTNGVLCVDELERSLHPILVRELLKLFQMRYYNEGTAQLLFTTHLVQLLDDSILRLSEVIIVDKNRQRGTKVKRLIEMKNAGEQIRNVTNFRKRYLKGYYSGVPKAAL